MSRAALTRPNGRKNMPPILPSQVQTQAYSQVSPYQGAAAAMGVTTTTAVNYPMMGGAQGAVAGVGYPYYPYPTGVMPTTAGAGGVMTPEAMAMMYYAQYYQQQAAIAAGATGTPDLTQLPTGHIEEEVRRSLPSQLTLLTPQRTKEVLPIHGNSSSFNINSLLYNNILESDYFKALYQLRTYHEVIGMSLSLSFSLLPLTGSSPPLLR
jgi:hypothetical protein